MWRKKDVGKDVGKTSMEMETFGSVLFLPQCGKIPLTAAIKLLPVPMKDSRFRFASTSDQKNMRGKSSRTNLEPRLRRLAKIGLVA
jgi:hypothetical protein